MLRRLATPHLKTLLRDSPAVALLGPRQSGKTTLARALGGRYYDLERQGERVRLDLQWEEVEAEKELVVLDEAQEHPEVFSNLRAASASANSSRSSCPRRPMRPRNSCGCAEGIRRAASCALPGSRHGRRDTSPS